MLLDDAEILRYKDNKPLKHDEVYNDRDAEKPRRASFRFSMVKEPGKVITCCNDGLRPVSFKLEATDDDAGPFLGRA